MAWRLANIMKLSNTEHLQDAESCTISCENQGTHPKTDIIRTLYDMWCGGRGSLWAAYRRPSHWAASRPETLRRRGCG